MMSSKTNRLNLHWLQVCVLLYAVGVPLPDIASAKDITTKARGTKNIQMEDQDYWNQFRGPNGDGKSDAKNLPVEFSEKKNVRWKTPIHDEGWSSPVVWGNQIWLTTGREDGMELFAVCVNLESGDVIHDIKVFDVMNPQKAYWGLNSHATPTIIEYRGQRQLISPAAEVTFSYNPANGKELWRVRHPGWGWNAACRPIFEHGFVYFTTGFSKHLLAVRPSGTGDITDTHVAWSARRNTPSVPSPLIIDDLLFMVSDQGFVSCLEAKTGRELWKERLSAGGYHWASPLYADGKLYFSGKKGVVSVIAAERKFSLLAENRFEASFIASPAIAADSIILRSLTHLYCVAEGDE
jgi:outer membrane protein assembly factor BamB